MITFLKVLIPVLIVFILIFGLGIQVNLSSFTLQLEHRESSKGSSSNLSHPLDYVEDTTEDSVEKENEASRNYKYHLQSEYANFNKHKSPIRLLCLILTQPSSLKDRGQAVFDTWGSRCTFLYFLSTESTEGDHGLPILHNTAQETYGNLWSKTKYGFQFAQEHLIEQIDWVMKADDDTYVIMENLHQMLSKHDPEEPTFFGGHFSALVDQGYMSGGAGYILSRKAVELVVTKAFPNETLCRASDDGTEDVEMGWCLSKIGVKPTMSRDSKKNEETFFPLHVWDMMTVKNDSWLYSYMSRKPTLGFACCSEYPISFHYISTQGMYEMEYLIYKLKLFNMKDIRENVEKRLNSALSSPSSDIT
ncbi:glycoprotein-N-acetylgalactosamine 3-beta-galactosyltransferase 1 [Eurytemora carolleeae]|uniref:glycoprotein-N-acetylgalactosamine 3-beta-galactosyltransferase 1 n=1 Tax=Eurytemora carolleeae TaxID=1294199 RepID=UPI000C774EA3|nr:glycoprotein-N-acetylgalactosamine 3-beta-galactosyltransferase 1 [Eurytemora carolleeae]|eukprot:XP_023340858.1 glycoprotein-N-acetylgalactosamine 3-beta-galactosyltransferase 1-like [Eurytemora affinis]